MCCGLVGGGGVGGAFTVREDYFTHFSRVNFKVGRKQEFPKKNHMTTRRRRVLEF